MYIIIILQVVIPLPSGGFVQQRPTSTSGISHGRAHDNVFNHADTGNQIYTGPHIGKVYVYQSPQVPDLKSSKISIKCELTPQIKPVLKALAWQFSPVSSKLYFLILKQQKKITCYY
jgi:hypothetical protein